MNNLNEESQKILDSNYTKYDKQTNTKESQLESSAKFSEVRGPLFFYSFYNDLRSELLLGRSSGLERCFSKRQMSVLS